MKAETKKNFDILKLNLLKELTPLITQRPFSSKHSTMVSMWIAGAVLEMVATKELTLAQAQALVKDYQVHTLILMFHCVEDHEHMLEFFAVCVCVYSEPCDDAVATTTAE